MIESIRSKFNNEFTQADYSDFLDRVNSAFGYTVPFRVAESPVFIGNGLKSKLLGASEKVVDFLLKKDFESLTNEALPENLKGRKNIGKPVCLAIDFAITKENGNELGCELIELQGAMSLYGFTELVALLYREVYGIPYDYTPFLSGLDTVTYWETVKKCLLGNHQPKNVILLEVYPDKQQNRLDFLCLENALGISTVCVSEIIIEGDDLYYNNKGEKTPVHKIINRVIVEELEKYPGLAKRFYFWDNLKVEWVNHPAWFFKISKFLLPYLKGEHFPETSFLGDFDPQTNNLNEFVLKPIYSCGGKGVNLNITEDDIRNTSEAQDYIIQHKVDYAPCVLSPDGEVKTEIRMLYLWGEDESRPKPVITLARLTRGDQMALRYNSNGTWVGASVGFFEK